MRTRQMKYLLTISRTGSMSKAANELGMSSQALGEAVRSLEEELGTRLLEKSYRGTLLTEAGNAFAEVSDVYFSNLEKIHQKHGQTLEEMKPIECMVMPHIASMVMPKLISALYKAHSDIRINMKEEADVTKIYQAVVNRQIELAIVTFLRFNQELVIDDLGQMLTFIALWEMPMYCLVPASWPIECSKGVFIRDLSSYAMIVTENPASNRFTDRLVHASGFKGKIIIENNYFIIRNMLQEGLGFFISTVWEKQRELFFDWQCNDALRAVSLKDDIRSQIGVVVKKEAILSQEATCFLAFCRAYGEN